MQKAEKIARFNPNGLGSRTGTLFGLPFDYDNSAVVVLPVPWEVTVSYSSGTADGPQAILAASPQLDLFDLDVPDAWQYGIHLLPTGEKWRNLSDYLRQQAAEYIEFLEMGGMVVNDIEMQKVLNRVNAACAQLKVEVKEAATRCLDDGKIVGVLGGDHSTPLGLMAALADRYDEFGILQIDAHADLRIAYEGFTYSHASIMYNAVQIPQISRLVSVGVRDLCEAEYRLAAESGGRVVAFYDQYLKEAVQITRQETWSSYCEKIISQLPQNVYVSFDIDGLDPRHCPNTGTPVAGGLEMHEAFFLLKTLVQSGRRIIGFDLCEVAPEAGGGEWNANVGARVLYKIATLAAYSWK